MKINTLISLALLTMVSTQALGHLVYVTDCDDSLEVKADPENESGKNPDRTRAMGGILGVSSTGNPGEAEKCYSDSQDAKDLRKEAPNAPESDRTAALTFCKMGGYKNPVDCASDILGKGLVEEAKDCIHEVTDQVSKLAIAPIAHQEGSDGGSPGVWHTHYVHSKENGWHRHDWTQPARDLAGNTYAAAQIDNLKKKHSEQSITTSKATTSTGSLDVGGAVTVGVGASVEINGGAGVSGSSEKGTSVEKGPIPQAELNKKWDEYYKLGFDRPQLGGVNPDIYCRRNEPKCTTSGGQIKNTSYQPDQPKKEGSSSKDSDDKKPQKKTSDNDSNNRTPTSSSSPDHGSDGIKPTDGGHWAGEPSKPSDGSMWVDIAQDPGYDPMGQCIFEAHIKKVKGESSKSYSEGGSADTRSPAEKKRDAEALLRKGICDETYYSRAYCANWKKKFQMIEAQPGAFDDSNSPVVRPLTPPGFLHFDPNMEVPKTDILSGFKPASPHRD